jgi:hypothetical protein
MTLSDMKLFLPAAILTMLVLGACKNTGSEGASEGEGGKLVPPSLDLQVEIDGKPAANVTSTLLKKTKPDFAEPEREVWLLTTLIPSANVAAKVVESEDLQGGRVVITKPGDANPANAAPALEVDKSGETRIILAQKGSPLPASVQRSGENASAQKARGVRRIRLIDPGMAQASGPKIGFKVILDDDPAKEWTSANTRVKPFSVAASDGEGQRDVWPLRDLAKEIAQSDDAMITAVVGEEGGKAVIEEAAWKDQTRIPVLRTNRRGAIKFTWLGDKHQGLIDAEEVRDVVKIKIKRHAAH